MNGIDPGTRADGLRMLTVNAGDLKPGDVYGAFGGWFLVHSVTIVSAFEDEEPGFLAQISTSTLGRPEVTSTISVDALADMAVLRPSGETGGSGNAVLRSEITKLEAQIRDLETKVRRDAPLHADFETLREQMNGGAR